MNNAQGPATQIYNGIMDISIDEYHGAPAISRSALMEFRRSPKHFWYKYINPDYSPMATVEIITKRNAMEFGNAVHTHILEPDSVPQRYVMWDGPSRATKAGKEAFAQTKSVAANRQIIDYDTVTVLLEMRASVLEHPEAMALIEGGKIEQSIFWEDQYTGLTLKARPDVWHDDFIVDLKSVADGSFDSFQRSIYSYGYHIQCAMQHEAVYAATGKNLRNFLFVAIEKEPPYAIGIYQLDDAALEQGLDELRSLTEHLKQCLDTDYWPAYSTNLVSLPAWATKKLTPIGDINE